MLDWREDVHLQLWAIVRTGCSISQQCRGMRLLALLSLAMPIAAAQEQRMGLELLQQALRDWKEGERHSLTARAWSELLPAITLGRWRLAATVRLSYGLQYLDLGDTLPSLVLPSENEVTTEFRAMLRWGWPLDPYIAVGCSTVLGESFRLQGLRRIRTARWWDPVTSSQSFGFAYGGTHGACPNGSYGWAPNCVRCAPASTHS
jgi:hypothetical protein